MKKTSVIVALVLVLGWTFLLYAQQKGEKTTTPDKKFVMDTAAGGVFEVEAGKIAVQRASSQDVKKFGQMMIDDHSKANEELLQLANQKGITPPKTMKKEHQDEINKISKLSGDKFDKAYIDMMVKDHKKDISEFKKEAKDGKDPDLKAWAAKTLPKLEEHLKMAQENKKK